ncbi:MAG: hypothetical protein IKB60_05235, partial [Clostridia bacterium]|nr:hypothetical protein [Clostridia bacterium]
FEKDIKEIKIEETQTEIEHTETKLQKTIKEEEPKEIPSAPTYKICGQVFDTYIIVEKDSQMLMVDQHAAHERLRFESLKESYKNRQIASQTLLTPAIIKLTPLEMSVFAENSDEINNLGFQAEEFGDNEIIVRGVPLELTDGEIRETIVEIISLYSAYRKNVDEQLVEKMLYSIACKGAIKANKRLYETEMKNLLDRVFSLPQINTCPHGRPITIAFTKDFIEKQFKRIV